MTYKEFGENARVIYQTIITVNEVVVHHQLALDTDEAIADLGKAERHNIVEQAIKEQFEDLAEVQDEE